LKGIILAGGTGSRLYPLTKVTNKHLLPVYNKPMIYYPIQTLLDAGIDNAVMIVGKENAGNFMNLLGSGKEFGIRLSYVLQDNSGGIAEALALTEDFVHGDDVLVVLGDNMIFDNMKPYVDSFKGGAKIFLKPVRKPERFGVPVFDSKKRIIKIEEKPSKPKSKYAVTGVYIYDSTVFDRIRKLKRSARGELEITDANNSYLSENKLGYAVLKKPWLDAGTFESLFEASETIKKAVTSGKKL
jgi:glucose-1-phosphate thymidylyltransferase